MPNRLCTGERVGNRPLGRESALWYGVGPKLTELSWQRNGYDRAPIRPPPHFPTSRWGCWRAARRPRARRSNSGTDPVGWCGASWSRASSVGWSKTSGRTPTPAAACPGRPSHMGCGGTPPLGQGLHGKVFGAAWGRADGWHCRLQADLLRTSGLASWHGVWGCSAFGHQIIIMCVTVRPVFQSDTTCNESDSAASQDTHSMCIWGAPPQINQSRLAF